MNLSRQRVLIVALYAGLLALLLFCGLRLLRSREQAAAAAGDSESCRQLASQIRTLKTTPRHASLQRQSDQDLSLKIETSAQLAEIAWSNIVHIDPQAARRLGQSPYLHHPTHLEIREVTLEQLVRFLRGLTGSESQLQATSLRLTAPRRSGDERPNDTWTVEVVLTQLVFSPE